MKNLVQFKPLSQELNLRIQSQNLQLLRSQSQEFTQAAQQIVREKKN